MMYPPRCFLGLQLSTFPSASSPSHSLPRAGASGARSDTLVPLSTFSSRFGIRSNINAARADGGVARRGFSGEGEECCRVGETERGRERGARGLGGRFRFRRLRLGESSKVGRDLRDGVLFVGGREGLSRIANGESIIAATSRQLVDCNPGWQLRTFHSPSLLRLTPSLLLPECTSTL